MKQKFNYSVEITTDFKGWTEHVSACAGAHQSPINIKTSDSKGVNYPKFTFGNYKTILPEIVTNNGHTGNTKF